MMNKPKLHSLVACFLAIMMLLSTLLTVVAAETPKSENFTYTMIEDYNSKTNVGQAMLADTSFAKYELTINGVDGSQALTLTTSGNNYAYFCISNLNPSNHRYLVMYINSSAEGANFKIRPHLNGNDAFGYYFSNADVTCFTPGGEAESMTSVEKGVVLKQGGYYYRFDLSNTPANLDLTAMWALCITVITPNNGTITIDDIYTTDSTSTKVPNSDPQPEESFTHTMIEDYDSKTDVGQAMLADTSFAKHELTMNGVGGSQALTLTTSGNNYAYFCISNLNPSNHRYLVMYINSSAEGANFKIRPHLNGNDAFGYYFSNADVTCFTPGGEAESMTSVEKGVVLKQGGCYYRFDLSNTPANLDLTAMWALCITVITPNNGTITIDDIYTTDSTSTQVPHNDQQSGEPFTHTLIEDYNSKTNVGQAMLADTTFSKYELAMSGVDASQALKLTTGGNCYGYLTITNINPSNHKYLVMYINSSTESNTFMIRPHMNGNDANGYYFSANGAYCFTPGGEGETLNATSQGFTLKQGGYYYRFDLSKAPGYLDLTSMWAVCVTIVSQTSGFVTIDEIYTTDSDSNQAPGKTGETGTASAWAKDEVKSAITAGLVPQELQKDYTKPIKKAQMNTMLQNALNVMGAPADVYTQVASMLSGEGNLSRLELALLVARLQELLGVESYQESFTFLDNDKIDANDKKQIDFAYEYSVVIATNNRTFASDKEYSVEEAIVSVNRLKNLYENVKANYHFTVSGAYGNGMILQRNVESLIVGTAPAGTVVTIQLLDAASKKVYEKSVTTAVTGKWSAPLMGQKGSFEAYQLTVSDAQTTVTFTDVLFGEVWVAGGQSNMELPICSSAEVEDWKEEEYGLHISFFKQDTLQANYIYTPLNTPTGKWIQATDYESIKDCSAVAISFAYKLYRSLNSGSAKIPVGIIYNAVGSTTITSWISRYEIENSPELYEVANKRGLYVAKGDWKNPSAHDTMSALYNTRIATFKGYSAAGILYYQGEGNYYSNSTYELSKYGLEALVRCWSEVFGNGKTLPIIVSDLFNNQANYYSTEICDVNEGYRDAAAEINQNGGKAYTVAIYDLDPIWDGGSWNTNPVHPRVKRAVGERMAAIALANIYDQAVVWTGPTLIKTEVKGNKLVLTFGSVGEGLTLTKGNTVRGFKIAGENLVYYDAHAVITGKDTIELWSESVQTPKAATYAYSNIAYAANVASNGLPMVPFRTDCTARATAYEKNDGAYYSMENQWQWCDTVTVWTTKDTAQWIPGSIGSATFAITADTKSEGDGALKVSYTTAGGKASFKPNLVAGWIQPTTGYDRYLATYPNTWLLFDVIGFDGTAIQVTFFDANGQMETLDADLYAQKTAYAVYKVDLTKLSESMRKAATDLQFVVSDSNESGAITLDCVRFANTLPKTKYIVTYVADGNTVATVEVEAGQNAVAPVVPEKEGYTGKWDTDGTNITADTTVTAVYTEKENPGTNDPGTNDNNTAIVLVIVIVAVILAAGAILVLVIRKKKHIA